MKSLVKYFIFIHCGLLFAQGPVKFNYSFAMNNCNSHSSTLLKLNNKYILLGLCSNTSTAQYNGINVLVTDTFGNEVFQKQIFSPNNASNYSYAIRPFTQINTRYATFTGYRVVAPGHNKGVISKIDLLTQDTIWCKSYSQPGDSTQIQACTSFPDSNIIAFGFRYFKFNNVNYSKAFLMKISKSGSYIWHKYLSAAWSTNFDIINKLINVDNNQMILAGIRQTTNFSGLLMRIDTNANIIYETGLSGYSNSFIQDAIRLNDGSYLAVGGYYSNGTKIKKIVYRFNGITGTKIIARLYNIESSGNSLTSVSQNESGRIFLGGATGQAIPWNMSNDIGDVLCLNSNLDSIYTSSMPNNEVIPYEILSTADNGFAATLSHWPSLGQQKNWLIKADSTGCFEVNCPINNGIEEAEKENGELKVWPNPATNHFNIRKFSRLNLSKINVSIVNYLGEVILKETIEDSVSEIQISCEQMKSGIYLIRLNSEKAFFETKLIINK